MGMTPGESMSKSEREWYLSRRYRFDELGNLILDKSPFDRPGGRIDRRGKQIDGDWAWRAKQPNYYQNKRKAYNDRWDMLKKAYPGRYDDVARLGDVGEYD